MATIARWEVRRTFGVMERHTLPVAIVLVVCLVVVTGFAAERGLHIQDGIYKLGTDNPRLLADIVGGDTRFEVLAGERESLFANRGMFDIIVLGSDVYVHDTEKGRAALKTLERDYQRYLDSVYGAQQDLFAAYPLWIEVQEVKSELDFSATQSGRQISALPQPDRPPVPENPPGEVVPPSPDIPVPVEDLRQGLRQSWEQRGEFARYTELVGPKSPFGSYRTPSQLSPPLPFDSIILVFLFIFPLYFSAQFYMMSIMQERVERRGEPLLSSPAGAAAIVVGKALPYFCGMLLLCAAIATYIRAPLSVLVPLVPVILFFLSSALVIGMV
ncbi:MAG: ABC transporter permease, partial [Methanolinea sp.]